MGGPTGGATWADTIPGAGQYCPISRTLDVVGERWTLLIVRDLIVGTTRFNDLARGLPGLSRSLLTKRLRHLERTGVVTRTGQHYVLTPAGRALEPIVFGMAEWGARYVFGDPQPEELDAQLLVWWMHTRVDTSTLEGDRHVVHVRFADDARRFWILVERGVPSVCMADPGYPVDLTISSRRGVAVCRVAREDAPARRAAGRARHRAGADRGDAPSRRGAAAQPGRALRRGGSA